MGEVKERYNIGGSVRETREVREIGEKREGEREDLAASGSCIYDLISTEFKTFERP